MSHPETEGTCLPSAKSKDLPHHVAIIPDGNGRWAKGIGEERTYGHIQGTARVKDTVIFAKELGIKILTIYAFSSENWNRPEQEVKILMDLLRDYLIQERQNIIENKIQLRAMGDVKKLPLSVLEELQKTIELSAHHQEMILNFAVSYGSRDEIIRAAKKMAQHCMEKKIQIEDMSERLFSSYLYTAALADPDLLIRTSGELRISNFLLWQMAYTEIYSSQVLWPDFTREEFLKALQEYQKRKRRYGLTQEQIEETR